MNLNIWLDGKIVPWEQANIHVMTHTLHYGSGAFEGIRCYQTDFGPAVFRLNEHIERLFQSFAVFGVAIPWTKEEIKQAVIETIKVNKLKNCYIRPTFFFGAESLLLSPKNLSVHCAIITIPMEKYLGKQPLKVGIAYVQRISPNALPIQSKINGFYVNSIIACEQARARGFDEALMLDEQNNIAEGSVANIFFVSNQTLITPPTSNILPGITRDSVINIAKYLNIRVIIQNLKLLELAGITEAFFTGTASEVSPIGNIEAKIFSPAPGEITKQITNAYNQIINGQIKEFQNWLTFIN